MRKLSHKNSNNKTSTNNYKFVEVLLLLVFLSECKRFDPSHLFLRIIDKQFIYLKFIMWFEKNAFIMIKKYWWYIVLLIIIYIIFKAINP
jgi:hypothetical protein